MKTNDEIITEFKIEVTRQAELIISTISHLFGKTDCICEQVILGEPSQDGILTSSLVIFFSEDRQRSELAYFFTQKMYSIWNTVHLYRPRYIVQDIYEDKVALAFDFRVPITDYTKQVN